MQVFGIELWEKSKKDFLGQILKHPAVAGQDDGRPRRSGVRGDAKVWIATVNPEFMVESWRDKRFLNILQKKTSNNVIDGHGVLWPLAIKSNFKYGVNPPVGGQARLPARQVFNKLAAFVEVFILGKYREKLITGVDLMQELCAMAEKEGIPVYFLGGWEPNKVAEYFVKKYKKLKVGGYAKDNFVETLHATSLPKRAIIFVALGMKKQEFWIEENWEKLPTGIVIGVGRSFDYYAGSIRRAPKWMRKIGLEWLFSALVDRSRALRQLKNLPVFVWKVLNNNSL